jgi:hypothetical protein
VQKVVVCGDVTLEEVLVPRLVDTVELELSVFEDEEVTDVDVVEINVDDELISLARHTRKNEPVPTGIVPVGQELTQMPRYRYC